ncbi:preprotein translocase subunit SecF [Fervidicella metallireducens AeB]|uniref:Protein-export membrane protein SecF n=1 Tax=Fervidicella metallireducens AeB TaxID=1403537 RepID=A0A017RZ12_9CLOT|nr:protein translocase subunit SecF [Fervidicella metallireducens]EYE89629.1 preprotein translocase subunit SecF [Fervidicella metallireducens AeB]
MFKIVEKSKLWFSISIAIIVIGMATWAFRGLNLGVDFKGGTVVTIRIGKAFDITEIRPIAEKYDSQAIVREIEGNEITITGQSLTQEEIPQLFSEIKAKYNLQDNDLRETEHIGPSIGSETRRSAFISVVVAVFLMLVYISFRFEYKSGVAAILALLHDVLVTISVYVLLQIPVNNSFIAAMLTILGYSINDTIVVFDRIRENNKLGKYKDFTTLANASITQTLARSINTVLTTLFTITSIYILGVPSIKEFALPLIVGILSGTYSSIFIATPIWMLWKNKGLKA